MCFTVPDTAPHTRSLAQVSGQATSQCVLRTLRIVGIEKGCVSAVFLEPPERIELSTFSLRVRRDMALVPLISRPLAVLGPGVILW